MWKKNYFLLASWKSLTKRGGSGSLDPLIKGTDPRIQTVPKCHEQETLLASIYLPLFTSTVGDYLYFRCEWWGRTTWRCLRPRPPLRSPSSGPAQHSARTRRCVSRVADPGSGALLAPWSGMSKKFRIRIRDKQPRWYFRELRNHFLGSGSDQRWACSNLDPLSFISSIMTRRGYCRAGVRIKERGLGSRSEV